jgi:hypothetical protein
MAIELKDVLSTLSIDADVEKLTPEEFKAQVESKYVLRDIALKDPDINTKIQGLIYGKTSTKLAQTFGLKSSDVDGKKMDEIFNLVKSNYDTQIQALTEQVGKSDDKKLTELQKQLAEAQSQLSVKDAGLQEWETKYATDVTAKENILKDYKLSNAIGKVRENLITKFSDEYTKNDLVKTGFETHINNTYIFDLDEKDNPVVKLKADGSFVKSKVKAGHIATPEEIFLNEMEAKGVMKKNNLQEKKITTFANEGKEGKSTVHPNAQKALERFQK